MIQPDDIPKLEAKWASERSLEPFRMSGGSKHAKIALVGEAWGEREDLFKHPFVGYAGMELARMLHEAGLTGYFKSAPSGAPEPYMMSHWQASGLFLTNVFADRPPNNKLKEWCLPKAGVPKDYSLPYLKSGEYIHPAFIPHLDRLYAELKTIRPNLIIALGNTACWALLGQTSISKIRGTTSWSKAVDCKVLPTYHPSAVLQNWSLRTIVLQDLLKAKREGLQPEIKRPERWVLINPTLDDIYHWALRPAQLYAVDIETKRGQITMVGFARSPQDAIVIPFINPDNTNYWATHEDEVRAWRMVKEMLERDTPKIFQNGLYDLSYLVKYSIRPRNCSEDTMLLSHSLWPEMRKGLDFLGSIWTSESSWKLMRTRNKDAEKRED